MGTQQNTTFSAMVNNRSLHVKVLSYSTLQITTCNHFGSYHQDRAFFQALPDEDMWQQIYGTCPDDCQGPFPSPEDDDPISGEEIRSLLADWLYAGVQETAGKVQIKQQICLAA